MLVDVGNGGAKYEHQRPAKGRKRRTYSQRILDGFDIHDLCGA